MGPAHFGRSDLNCVTALILCAPPLHGRPGSPTRCRRAAEPVNQARVTAGMNRRFGFVTVGCSGCCGPGTTVCTAGSHVCFRRPRASTRTAVTARRSSVCLRDSASSSSGSSGSDRAETWSRGANGDLRLPVIPGQARRAARRTQFIDGPPKSTKPVGRYGCSTSST